jgi:hypothetical protein
MSDRNHEGRAGRQPGAGAGISRRDALRVGGLTALGLGLADFARRRAVAEAAGAPAARARHCILIWLDGGPSHLETFDLKPEAPSEVRGPFQPIDTRVPGLRISEYLPRTAALLDRVAIVRSVTSTLGEHNFGSQYLLTGYKPTPALTYPGMGAVLAHQTAPGGWLPPHVAIPDYNAAAGAGYLPAHCAPFAVGGDPAKADFRVRDLDAFPGVTPERLRRRRGFLADFDRFRGDVEAAATDQPADADFDRAYRLVTSAQARAAFDLAAEPPEMRARYGDRTIGQSCLLARRLVEAGVPFVTVTDDGWDTHDNLFNRLKEGYTGGTVGKVPNLDVAYAALLSDLADRGLLDETLVVLMGEFGRTPKLNTMGGRDHWPRVFSVALAGGGARGGQVVGRSDERGESPADGAVTPADLATTIFTLLGIDPALELHTADGRPVRVGTGEVIGQLL